MTRNIGQIEKLITAAEAEGSNTEDLEKRKKSAEEDLAVRDNIVQLCVMSQSYHVMSRSLNHVPSFCTCTVHNVLPESFEVHQFVCGQRRGWER